jgi:hypothetical protein
MLPRPTTDNSRRGKSELRFHDGNGDKFDWRIVALPNLGKLQSYLLDIHSR